MCPFAFLPAVIRPSISLVRSYYIQSGAPSLMLDTDRLIHLACANVDVDSAYVNGSLA